MMTQTDKKTVSDALNVYAQSMEIKANTAMIGEDYSKEIKLRNEADRIREIMKDWDNNVVSAPFGTVRI